ncbi:MAG: hypothetical protein QME21_13070 [Anaerolineales bacterium]|nr:hypothetical protein [Anaerolineales bacterium]
MKTNLRVPFLAAISMLSGLVVLVGYFVTLPGLSDLRGLFLDWAVILTAVAAIVGVANLAKVHWRKVRTGQPGAVFSLTTLTSLVLTILVVIFLGGATSTWSLWLFNYALVPVEASLLAVLSVTLIYAFARMINRRLTIFNLIFAGTALFILITAFAWSGFDVFGLRDIRSWVLQVWAAAGARGILLGVALGAIATGLRVLIGSDRPYSG